MQQLFYAGDHFLVADSICQGVLQYCRVLGNAGKADVITVPYAETDGTRSSVHLLVGPASQIYTVPVRADVPDPEDDRILRWLQDATAKLEPDNHPSPFADEAFYDDEWWTVPDL